MRCKSRQSAGLTLIEVLIALAIVGIAMTAVIKATSQNIRGTNHLQTKTLALWVGQNVLNEARTGVLKLQSGDDSKQDKTDILGNIFYWHATQSDTPNKRIKKVTVDVFDHEANGEDESPVVQLETYLYGENQ
jgi:general secretion pathway protein I